MKAGKESSPWTNGRQSVMAELLAAGPAPCPHPSVSFGNVCSDAAGCPSAWPPLGRSLPAMAPGECWQWGPGDTVTRACSASCPLAHRRTERPPLGRGKPSQRQEKQHPAGRSRFQPDPGGTSSVRKQSKDLERGTTRPALWLRTGRWLQGKGKCRQEQGCHGRR